MTKTISKKPKGWKFPDDFSSNYEDEEMDKIQQKPKTQNQQGSQREEGEEKHKATSLVMLQNLGNRHEGKRNYIETT